MAGYPDGANDLDIYDAACVALADLESIVTGTEFTTNAEGREKLMALLTEDAPVSQSVAMAPQRAVDPEAEMAEMRAEMERRAAAKREREAGAVES